MSIDEQSGRFIDILRELDGSAGNQRLRTRLGRAEPTYNRIKAHLIEERRRQPMRFKAQ